LYGHITHTHKKQNKIKKKWYKLMW
jgi:hypothetical protein